MSYLFNIHMGFAGCRMKVKMEARCEMIEISMVGCGIKIFWRELDLLILKDGMWDSFKIDSGIQDEKQDHTSRMVFF